MSVDHSEVQDLITAGDITADEAKTHPDRNVVTRSLGTDPGPVPDMWVFPPVAGERFLICSDGLPRELDDAQIEAILHAETIAQEAATALVARAVEAGGHDNITVVVIDFAGSMTDGLRTRSTRTQHRARTDWWGSDDHGRTRRPPPCTRPAPG